MRVKLECKEVPADLAAELEIPPVPDSSLKRAFQALAKSLNAHPAMSNLATGLSPADYPDIEFASPGDEITVEIMLIPNRDAYEALGVECDDTSPLGVFLTTGGPLEGEESYLATRFRVLVLCDEREFVSHLLVERDSEMDPSSTEYDHEYVAAFLNTLTHEVAHAVEFISHGHGLTPAQVEIWNDMGVLDRDLTDIITGRWIRADMQDDLFVDIGLTTEVMEVRVERTGRKWLSDCLSLSAANSDELRECFTALCEQAKVEMEHFYPVHDQPFSFSSPGTI